MFYTISIQTICVKKKLRTSFQICSVFIHHLIHINIHHHLILQIDLYDLVKITSITTKGRVDGYSSQFFKSFSVEFTTDGYEWQTYTQKGIKAVSDEY